MVNYFKNKHDNVTTNLQSLLYICLVLSGYVKQRSNFPCGNSLFEVHILMRYLRCNISTWGKSEKAISTWLHRIRTKRIHPPGRHHFLTLHRPSTFEASPCPTKRYCSSKYFTHLNLLQSYLLRNIGMWNVGLVHCKKLKPVLELLTKHNPVIRASKSYKIKYAPIE